MPVSINQRRRADRVLQQVFLQKTLEREIARAGRHNNPFPVLFVDLNNVKLVNDQMGHFVGDRVWQQVAQELKRNVTSDMVARWGGDEFIALFPGAARDTAYSLSERIVETIDALGNTATGLTVSVGLATYPVDGVEAGQLMRVAGQRMYEYKSDRRWGLERCNPELT